MKILKFVLITVAVGAAASMPSGAIAGPRPEFLAAKASVAASAKRATVMHAAGPRSTIAVFKAEQNAQLASVGAVDSCKGHRAGPRASVCM